MRRMILVSFVLLALAPAAAFADEPSWKVVVHPSNPLEKISREDLSRLFLKKKSTWNGDKSVVPVEPAKDSALRKSFNAEVHKKSAAAISSYWQQLIFSGRDVPPQEKSSDADVLSFVKSNEQAIGYVGRAAPEDGVKVLVVTD